MQTTKLVAIQQIRLVEIGKYLLQLRQEQSISLEQLELQTKIRRYYLEAIERGDLSNLPPAIYVQGFIKIYANALECDGKDLALTFPITFDKYLDTIKKTEPKYIPPA